MIKYAGFEINISLSTILPQTMIPYCTLWVRWHGEKRKNKENLLTGYSHFQPSEEKEFVLMGM